VTTTLPDDQAPPAPEAAGPAADGAPAPGAERGWRGLWSWVRTHRILPGLWFPVVVWVLWRLASLAIVLWHGGLGVESAYSYDGAHYLRILHHGYWDPRPVMPAHAFFPGVPWLAAPVWWLTGSDAITAHVVATATGLGAFVAVWGATREWRDERTGRRAVVLLALFPSSLFLWMFYSEALFIGLGAGAVWADRRGRRGWAAVALFGLATTRSVGILVPAALVLARIVRQRRIDRWALAYAAAGVAGLGAVMLTMQRQLGNAVAFLSVQDDWGRNVSWPWASVLQGIDNLTPDGRTVMVPALVARNLDLWAVGIVVVAIAYLAFAGRVGRGTRAAAHRFPMEAWMLGVAMIAVPLSSSVLASFNRFALGTWVIFPAYAAVIGRLPRWARALAWLAVAVAGVLVAYALIGRIAVGRFIG
jgi:hypothetical protein